MKLKSYIRETLAGLKKLDLDPVVVSTNKHVKIRISHPGDRTLTTVLTLGVSESDWRGGKNTKARINRFMKTGSQDGCPKDPNLL